MHTDDGAQQRPNSSAGADKDIQQPFGLKKVRDLGDEAFDLLQMKRCVSSIELGSWQSRPCRPWFHG